MANLLCENHPLLRWQCKDIAVNENGRYNQSRNIFFMGEMPEWKEAELGTWEECNAYTPECSCPVSCLIEVSKHVASQKVTN